MSVRKSDIVVEEIFGSCTCHDCSEKRQRCGADVRFVARHKDDPVIESLHSTSEGLEWSPSVNPKFDFGFGETEEEALAEFLDDNNLFGKQFIVVGRHKPDFGNLEFEITEQLNINFPSRSEDCKPILKEIISMALENCSSVVFQTLPGQVVKALFGVGRIVPCGVIVNIPGDRPSGVEKIFDGDIAEAVRFANPRARTEFDGANTKVVVDPPLRFKFSHIEWF